MKFSQGMARGHHHEHAVVAGPPGGPGRVSALAAIRPVEEFWGWSYEELAALGNGAQELGEGPSFRE